MRPRTDAVIDTVEICNIIAVLFIELLAVSARLKGDLSSHAICTGRVKHIGVLRKSWAVGQADEADSVGNRSARVRCIAPCHDMVVIAPQSLVARQYLEVFGIWDCLSSIGPTPVLAYKHLMSETEITCA